jgi:hypothetical protein
MAGVSSTDSGQSNYYQQTIRDLQHQLDTDRKRSKEMNEKEVDEIRKNHEADLTRRTN